jgi:hypothetical protein
MHPNRLRGYFITKVIVWGCKEGKKNMKPDIKLDSAIDKEATKNVFFTEKTAYTISIVAVIVLIGSVFVFVIFGSWSFSSELDESKIAQFGDFVGGFVGPLFAFVGVILFYVALTDQRKDIKINQSTLENQVSALNHQIMEFQAQNKELEAQRQEMMLTRKIYEQQSETMRTQQFDSIFFSLLNVYISIKNNLNNDDSEKDFFKKIFTEMKLEFSTIDPHICHNEIIQRFSDVYLKHQGILSHYFKTIYRIAKTIDSSTLTIEDKFSYFKILRSQMTEFEQIILYYDYHTIYGEKSCRMALKYNLLKHIQILSKGEFYFAYNFKTPSDRINLMFFLEFISKLLSENINKSYDIESEVINIQEKFDIYNCIVGLFIDDKIQIQIICAKDTFLNKLPFSDEGFQNFICHFLFDKLFYSQFLIPTGSEIQKEIRKTEGDTIFSYSIISKKAIKISCDI